MRLCLDSNIFIYAMETDHDEGLRARRCMRQIERGDIEAVTSERTLAEVLRGGNAPLRTSLFEAYVELLSPGTALRVLPVTRELLIRSSQMELESKISVLDAIHVATALIGECDAFLTEDRKMPVPVGLQKVSLADWIPNL